MASVLYGLDPSLDSFMLTTLINTTFLSQGEPDPFLVTFFLNKNTLLRLLKLLFYLLFITTSQECATNHKN